MDTVATRQLVQAGRGGNPSGRASVLAGAVGLLARPALYLRVEGAALLALALAFYATRGGNWWVLALLFLVPDVSALGYLGGKTIGAACYNVAHTIALPLGLGALAFLSGASSLALIAAIWLAHIGWDRLIGYGLKDAADRRATDEAVDPTTDRAVNATRS